MTTAYHYDKLQEMNAAARPNITQSQELAQQVAAEKKCLYPMRTFVEGEIVTISTIYTKTQQYIQHIDRTVEVDFIYHKNLDDEVEHNNFTSKRPHGVEGKSEDPYITDRRTLNTLRHRQRLRNFTCADCDEPYASAYPQQRRCSPKTKHRITGQPGQCAPGYHRFRGSTAYQEKRWPDGQPLATWWNPDYLRRFRLRLELTQGQLADLIGIHKNSVCRAERGIGVIKKPAALAKLDELRAKHSGDDPQFSQEVRIG